MKFKSYRKFSITKLKYYNYVLEINTGNSLVCIMCVYNIFSSNSLISNLTI